MLTVLVGSDAANRGKRLDVLSSEFRKKNIDVVIETDVSFDADRVRSIAGSTSLFGGTSAVILKDIGDNTTLRDQLEKILPALAESPHQFIVSANTLLASFIKKAKSVDARIEEYELKIKPKKVEAFNSFLLSDALYDRKRSVAWPLYRQAIDLGLESRELHGKIIWAVKTMLLAARSRNASESGLNPFVHTKALAGSKNYTEYELKKMLSDLTTLFHEALVSGLDLETALESFILTALDKKTSLTSVLKTGVR